MVPVLSTRYSRKESSLAGGSTAGHAGSRLVQHPIPHGLRAYLTRNRGPYVALHENDWASLATIAARMGALRRVGDGQAAVDAWQRYAAA